jgi:hypothetical protein
MTDYLNEKAPDERADNVNRTRSPAMWLIGTTFLIALLGVMALYSGQDGKPKSGDNPSNVVSESRGSK